MCDTLVAAGDATADGSVILAKNSDRAPNEAQALTHIPRAHYEPGATVRCTYVEIPQVRETYEVLLSRPFWLWGCEMGANECGVAIGNEAVFTKEPYERGPGLVGMDFIRLALERAASARQALEVITELLSTYGQGGNCGFGRKSYYHNSFLIADPGEAWVLETAGRFWAAERVHGVRTISNRLTIGSRWDLASPGLVEHAIEKGWCKSPEGFHFARCYSDPLDTWRVGARARDARSTDLLEGEKGRVTVATMMAALRDHGAGAAEGRAWNPGQGWRSGTLCMHAGLGPLRPSQTTGSLVAHLTPDLATCWLTGTSAPCTGVFKPVYLGGAGLPDLGPEPGGTYEPRSLWWAHERLHRAVIRDYPTRLPLYQAERDALEAEFLAEATELQSRHRQAASAEQSAARAGFTASCFERAAMATARWAEAVSSAPVRHRPALLFSWAWRRSNREAGLA